MPATNLRDILLPVQRAYRIQPGLIAEGRDMASVVFPDACLKIFLVAQASSVPLDGMKSCKANDNYVNMQHISSVMSKRDTQDRDRTLQTLQSHPDTMVIDTSVMAIDDVVNQVLSDPRMSAYKDSINLHNAHAESKDSYMTTPHSGTQLNDSKKMKNS